MSKLNSELIRIYLRNVIVVYALMATQGDLQRLRVKQSPDQRLNPSKLAAFGTLEIPTGSAEWSTVPLKVLIGISVLAYE